MTVVRRILLVVLGCQSKKGPTNRLELKHRIAGLHGATETVGDVIPSNVELISEVLRWGSKILALAGTLT